MNDLVRKHWTSLLGALFIISAFVYLFKFTFDQYWFTEELKIGLGLIVGAGLAALGMKLAIGRARLAGEIVCGLGSAIVYATFTFAGIYDALWDAMTVFLCMMAVTVLLAWAAYRFGLRTLINIVLLGSLVAPLVLRSESDQVFTLFLYLLVLNTAFFFLSIRQSWTELRLLAFAGTWLLYVVYYVHFEPDVSRIWSMPFRYATAAYVFYLLGFVLSSWRGGKKFDGLNLYLGFANAVIYGLWTVALLDGYLPFAYPLAVMGLSYVALAYVVYRVTRDAYSMPVLTKSFGGLFLLLLAGSQIGKGLEIKPLLSVYFWGLVAVLLIAAGQKKRIDALKLASVLVWFFVGCYWMVVTWDTPRGEWFGVYIPFLNWGAMAWAVLAGLGFYFATKVKMSGGGWNNPLLANLYAVLSHLIVGGLLTVQVSNVFEEYRVDRVFDLALTLSVTWGIYALLLFLWGAYSKQRVFRVFGSAVLILMAAKTLLFDLAGEDTIYKVIVLFALGVISLAITYINSRWMSKQPQAGYFVGGAAEAEAQEDMNAEPFKEQPELSKARRALIEEEEAARKADS
ncbi:DUF2339 domain-containing protein [Paenibacillus sp. MBLB4367]|uniref:DUF2339 domain-containing protein n=1 Tax=Paenibacillus sp. MBLB4367 TaxID=3384767 RepID=UPI003907F1E3